MISPNDGAKEIASHYADAIRRSENREWPNFSKESLNEIERIYKQKLNAGEIDRNVFEKNYKILTDGFSRDYKKNILDIKYDDPDWDFVQRIKTNFSTSAAFKNHKETLEISQLLIDSKGESRSFHNFKKQALKISDTYNQHYLKVEYMHANRAANMGKKFQRTTENKEPNPNLKYMTQGDGKVRNEHAQIDGTTYPVDSVFWSTHLPPNGWGCRYTIMPTKDIVKDKGEIDIQDMFKIDYGQKLPFSREHPYFNYPDYKTVRWAQKFNGGLKKEFLFGKDKPPTLIPKSEQPLSHELAMAKEYNKIGFLAEFLPQEYKHGKAYQHYNF